MQRQSSRMAGKRCRGSFLRKSRPGTLLFGSKEGPHEVDRKAGWRPASIECTPTRLCLSTSHRLEPIQRRIEHSLEQRFDRRVYLLLQLLSHWLQRLIDLLAQLLPQWFQGLIDLLAQLLP